MDNKQRYSSKRESEDYYKLLAHGMELLVTQSHDLAQQQLPLII